MHIHENYGDGANKKQVKIYILNKKRKVSFW